MTYYEVKLSDVVLYRSATLERCRHYIEKLSRMNPDGVFSVDFGSNQSDNSLSIVNVKRVHI